MYLLKRVSTYLLRVRRGRDGRQVHDLCVYMWEGLPCGSEGKASAHNAGDPGLIPGWGRSPGEGNSNPLQYPYLENPLDGGA